MSIRVLIVDDSPTICRVISAIFATDPDFAVAGCAHDGSGAVRRVLELRPDLVTLDLDMPGGGGLPALEEIMAVAPTPVLVVSGVSRTAAAGALRALELGAIDFVLKYAPGVGVDPIAIRRELLAKARSAAQIQVIRSLDRSHGRGARSVVVPFPGAPSLVDLPPAGPGLPDHVVVLGASTGGPSALRDLLRELPAELPAAVLVVQHLPATFTGVLAAQLDRNVALPVGEAVAGQRLQAGRVYVAPGDRHLLLRSDGRLELGSGPPVGGHRPSIDVTMQSVAQVVGPRARGVVLTGMGSDGTEGLRAIRAKGGETFAQDAASSVVHGMPLRAIERGVVDQIAPPERLARLVLASVVRGIQRRVG